jgi:hypothetical protein
MNPYVSSRHFLITVFLPKTQKGKPRKEGMSWVKRK